MKISASLFTGSLLLVCYAKGQECPSLWKCHPTKTASPTLDANLDEWTEVEGIETSIKMITGVDYAPGAASYKCLYDESKIYFALEVPGFYRFNATDNHHCAAIATMMKVGVDATFLDMGGCSEAGFGSTCDEATLQACKTHRVDIGAHWELKTTTQGVMYPIGEGDSSVSAREAGPPGDDPVANKDDEWAVSPYCRFDDDDANAGNEWAGAWRHTNPVDGELGSYVFELSRLLKTPSLKTDGQMIAGETYSFGVAFWDPFQMEESGWTDVGHYLTGCSADWIELELVAEGTSDGASRSFTTLSLLLTSMVGAIVHIL